MTQVKKFGIIGAMEVEIQALQAAITAPKEEVHAGMAFYEGAIQGVPVVVVRCGAGKVNAALCAQILIDCYDVTHLINTGVAGSLNNDIDILDVVVSRDAVYHDMDATQFGYAIGQVPSMDVQAFPADAELAEAAEAACRKAAPENKVFRGRIASGDQFISEEKKKDWIRDTFDADCCEMEGAAIAQTAYRNKVPYVILRAISDKADESIFMSYDEFEIIAAKHCAEITLEMIRSLG